MMDEFITYEYFNIKILISTHKRTTLYDALDKSTCDMVWGDIIPRSGFKEIDITPWLWQLVEWTDGKPWLEPNLKFLWPKLEHLNPPLPENEFDVMYKTDYSLRSEFTSADRSSSYMEYDYWNEPHEDIHFCRREDGCIEATTIYWMWLKKTQEEPFRDHKVTIHWGKDYDVDDESTNNEFITLKCINDRPLIKGKGE